MGNSTNLLRLRNLALVAMVFFFNGLFAQLSGIKTIPTNYASIAAFVADVNTQGVGAGGVTLNVPAGYTETLTGKITMTATGTAANPIIIQKSGAGANPKLTSYVGTVATPSVVADGFFVLAGSDYVTIDGIDLQESAANTTTATVMEFGYGLFLASATDGAQNNTIKNCVITLNRLQNTAWTAPGYNGSTGIAVLNGLATASGAVTITAASGTNSNNKFYTNTIQNCNAGIVFKGFADVSPFALSDTGNDVGGSSVATGNSILNFGGGAATNPSLAIYFNNQYGINVSYNTINNNNGTGVNHATTFRGIYCDAGTGVSMNINNNTITLKTAVTTSQVSAIELSAGSTGTGNTINVNNNTITGCTNDLATTSIWYGIYNTGAPATLNINNNTFSSNVTKHTSGTVSLIYNTGAITTALSISNNNLSHGFNAAVAQTGTFYGIRNTGAAITANAVMSNNVWANFSFTTLSSTTAYFFYNTGGFNTNNTNNNTWNNITWNNTGTIYGFYITGVTQTVFNFNNNSITTGFTRLGAAGSMYTMYFLGSSLGTCIHTVSNNNFSNITAATAGTGSFYGMYNSDGSPSPYPQKNIFNNTFNNITYNSTGTFYGMYVSYLGDGTTSQGSRVYNNTISNYTGSQTMYCIYMGSTASPNQPAKFYNNTLTNITNNSTTSSMYGVYGYSSTVAPYVEFYNNKIAGLTTATTTGKLYGFYGISGAFRFRIHNNYFGNFNASGAMTTTMPAPAIAGLYLVSTSEYKVYNNTIYLNATSTGANFSTVGLYDGATGAGIVDFRNNNVVNTSVTTGSGLRVAVQNVGTTTANYASTSNNNNLYTGATSSSSLTYYDGTNTALTVLNMSAITLTDGSSVAVAPTFLSTVPANANYLHIDATVPTQIESGGQNMPTFFTTDFDGDIRVGNAGYTGTGGTYDIGADEFNGITPAPLITALVSTPALSQLCITAPRTITCNVSINTGTVTTVMLGYSFNGVAQTPIAMTNTTGNTWSGVLPASTPANANVFWAISATGSNGIITNLTGAYADEPLLGMTSFAWNTGSPICAGTSTGLQANLSANLPATVSNPNYLTPVASSPTSDEDLGNVTITNTSTSTVVLNNTTPITSQVGTIGTATGTLGGYANFTAFGPYAMTAGSSYSFSLTSITTGTNYNNSMAIFIDYNRNGSFTDAGEAVYAGAVTVLGPHIETGSFTIPTTAYNGLTRMRVVCIEGTMPTYSNTLSFGEYEDYMLNISSTTPGGGNPPAITAVSWASSTVPAYATGNPATINPTVTDNYIATVTAMGCTVTSTPTTVNINALPAAPIATNSSQCGTSAPTASVASGAGTAGNGQFYWYSAATAGNLLQSPPIGAYTTFYSNDFANLTIGAGATLSGVASLSAVPGQLQITPNSTSQLGGITVNAGINAQVYKVDFDVTTTPIGGADGFSYSFGDDVNAASTSPTAEMGSGSKVKISFDSYGVMPNGSGIYVLYNNTATSFNATTPGVLAYVANTSWVGSANNHVTVDINAQGGLTLTLNGTILINNVALPSSYVYADKSTWKHVIAGRTGGISMQMLFDNLVIQTASQIAGSTTYGNPISATTTFYVSEVGTNGCVSPTAPVLVTVSQPDPIAVTSGVSPAYCLGQSFTSTASSAANPAYTYEWDIATYTGTGISAPVTGATLTTTPTVAGVYPFTVTGTNGICTEVKTVNVTINALPVITTATATPSPACHDSQVALNASSIVSGPQTLPTGYCSTTNSGGTGCFMDNVVFGSISNNTAASNPTATPYYTNYNLTTNVQPGQTYPLSVTVGPSGTYTGAIMSVWIDYNRDGVLTAAEWQQIAVLGVSGTTVTINVTVPANAQMGLTKMRIRSRGNGNTNGSGDACVLFGSGETEDYLVNIQSAPAVPYSYSWNSTPAINTLNGSTLVTNVTSAPVTQTWTLTATEAATGCVNTMTTAPVTINQFFTAPTATNSAHCGVQVPTAVVADPNAFTAPVYNWYTVPTGGTAVQATTSPTITSAVSTTTTYYVSTTNPSTGCQSARTPVTVTVSAPPALALSNATATNCSALASPVVTLASGGSSFDNFTWSPSATVAGTSAAGYTFNPTNLVANSPATTTTYTLTAAQTTGALCVNTTSIVVSTNALPLITSTTAGPAATCAGTTVNLAAASSTFAPLAATLGCNSGSNTTTTYPTPFGNWYWGAKQQFLFTAAELQAAGLVAGNISSVAFNVTTPTLTTLSDYTISMKNSSVTALTTTFETGMTSVYYAASFTPSSLTGYANNTFNFNVASFPWDGTSNVVVEICFNNGSYTTNAAASYCTTFAGAAHYYNSDAAGVCSTVTGGTLTNNRTDMMFGGTTGTNWTPTLAWSWPSLNINGATNTTTAVNAGTTNVQTTYTVQATNTVTGCSNTATTTPITIYALPQIGAGNDILMCTNNGSQNFTPTGTGAGVGGTYTWNNGAINATPFTVTQTTQFVVTGVDANTCVNYDTLQVVFSTVPPVNAGVDQQICIGQTASLPATGFAPYTWNTAVYPGSGISAPVMNPSLVVTPTVPGVYTYTVGVGNSVGCTNQDQVQLTVWALPVVNAGVDQTICNASPAIISGSGALTYTWTNNVTNATPFFPSSTATYTVDGVDIHGCHNVDQMVVNVLPQPIVNGGIDQTICATTPAILFAQTTANTPTAVTGFQWNNSVINGQQFTPTATATYTVTATGANGCTNQDQVVVTVLALPTVNAGNDITVCAGLNATLNATGAVSYSWNNGITQAIPFYPNATTTYTVTGTGANGCSNQDQVVVNVSTGPNVTVTGNQIVCANAPATLSAASTNSMGGFWTTSNGLGTISPNVSNGTVTYVPTTNDPVVVNLTYVASNACGNAAQSTTVTVLPIPTVNAGPDIASCSGLPVTLSATSNGFITWNNNVSNNVAFVPGSSATYTVTAVGANNCTNSDQMVLTVLALPDVNAGADQTICSGSTATLNGSGANTYLWNNGVVNSVAFAPTATQTYTVTGTALNGCQSSDQVLVTVNATPVALVSVVDGATVAASPAGMNYQWINCASGTDIPTATAAQFTATANGSYAVIVTSLQGCEDVSDCITISSVGLDQINVSDMNVFPNPTNGEVNVSMPENMMVDVQIFDAQGKLVAEQMNVTNNGKLNISNVTPGVYMVRLTAENAVQTFRVVKN
jgi:hypothetical protein